MRLFYSLLWSSFVFLVVNAALNTTSDPAYTDYLFAYFTGEGYVDGETISFAVSNGNNALSWSETHGGKPVLISNLGTKGVRDPSIIRSQDGSKFWILATDLKMYGNNGGWDAAGRAGSRSIVIWESADLKKWSSPRLVTVSPPTAGNTWAPEAVYDLGKQMYMVFWASALYPPSDAGHRSQSYYRIMRSMTKDFVTFSPAQVYIDTGSSVIDTTIVFDDKSGRYFRFSKDERSKAPDGKSIFEEWSTSLDGPWKAIKAGIGKGAIQRGEGPTVVKSNTVPGKWHMFIDEFGGKIHSARDPEVHLILLTRKEGRGYVPFESTDIAAADWKISTNYKLPKRPRHGSVIPITEAERKILLAL